VRSVEVEGQRGMIAGLFARVIGGGPARTSRPDSEGEAMRQQPRLGGIGAEERLPSSQTEDDLLDIPAFLRRQAN
jgi:cell division protein FtsZ